VKCCRHEDVKAGIPSQLALVVWKSGIKFPPPPMDARGHLPEGSSALSPGSWLWRGRVWLSVTEQGKEGTLLSEIGKRPKHDYFAT